MTQQCKDGEDDQKNNSKKLDQANWDKDKVY